MGSRGGKTLARSNPSDCENIFMIFEKRKKRNESEADETLNASKWRKYVAEGEMRMGMEDSNMIIPFHSGATVDFFKLSWAQRRDLNANVGTESYHVSLRPEI